MSLHGLFALAPGESFTPLHSKEAAALKCASCAAPLGPHEARCSYCLSWNPAHAGLGNAEPLEVTTLEDPVPRYWVGLKSPVTGGYVASSKPQVHETAEDREWRDRHPHPDRLSWFQRLLGWHVW